MVYLGRPNQFKFFKDCLPQIWLGPFLNTLNHLPLTSKTKLPFGITDFIQNLTDPRLEDIMESVDEPKTLINRSRPEVFYKKGFLKNFAKFTRKNT